MIGPEGEPLARRYYSQDSGKDLDADEMVRGFETDKGKFVLVTDEELERLAPDKSRDIDLRRFVQKDAVPPLLFDRGYFLVPDGGSEKAYRLLAATMEKNNKAGMATFVMRGKEYLVAIIAENGILLAETLRFPDEVREPKDIELPAKKKVSTTAVKRFQTMISKKAKAQLPTTKLKNKQAEELLKLVEKKRKRGKDVIEVETPERSEESNVVDLVAMLKKSLSGKAGKGRKRSVA